MGQQVIIVTKGGLYWLPDSCGYTSDIRSAGIYDSDEMAWVERDTDRRDRMLPVPENHDFVMASTIEALRTERDQLRAQVARLREALQDVDNATICADVSMDSGARYRFRQDSQHELILSMKVILAETAPKEEPHG